MIIIQEKGLSKLEAVLYDRVSLKEQSVSQQSYVLLHKQNINN